MKDIRGDWVHDLLRDHTAKVRAASDDEVAAIHAKMEDSVRGQIRLHEYRITWRERSWRRDEHKVLASLDEDGRKRRYFELAQEGT